MHPRFQAALTTLVVDLQTITAPMLADPHFPALLEADRVATLQQVTGLGEDVLAFALLPLAAACARADLSHFNVGAIVRGVSGHWYFGGNMEFLGATIQQTVHTEQSVIGHAWLYGEIFLRVITVNYMPCGHCRQLMNELNSGLALCIHLPGREAHALEYYLPDAFDPKDLEIKTLLMNAQNHGLLVSGGTLIQAAIQAANCRHMPYSHSPSDVALELKDGIVFSDSYAENTALNPTLPPLQGALNLLGLNGHDYPAIQRAILAEKADVVLVQWDTVVATPRVLSYQNIERVPLG